MRIINNYLYFNNLQKGDIMFNKFWKKGIVRELLFGILVISLLSTCQAQKDKKDSAEGEQETSGQMQQQAPGDIEVSDEEVEQFISLNQEIQKDQQKFQQEFMQILQNSTLGLQKYQTMAQAMNDPNSDKKDSFSDADMQTYNELTKQMQKIQSRAQKEAESMIEDSDIGMDRFNAISNAANKDTALQNRLRNEMMKQMQKNQPAGVPAPGGQMQ